MEGCVNYRFTLPGAPRTKKTSNRILKMGTRNVIMPSKAWMAWKKGCLAYVATKPELGLYLERPVNCRALIYRDANHGDSSGYISGLADVLEEINVVLNDKHITQWDGTRLLKDADNPRVEVTLTVLKADRQEALVL